MKDKPVYTKQDLHLETARISWPELELHFARGVLIKVAFELDLVAVATCFANDDKDSVERWTAAAQLGPVDIPTAKHWSTESCELWAVVVAPWVLVQENLSTKSVDKSVD